MVLYSAIYSALQLMVFSHVYTKQYAVNIVHHPLPGFELGTIHSERLEHML